MKLIYSLHIGKNENRNGEFCGYRNKKEMLDSLLLTADEGGKHYEKVELYCDTKAKELIEADGRQFPFTSIIVCLDGIEDWLQPDLWAYVKVLVYSLQDEPFIHLDNDAFLWGKLPKELMDKPFIFQHKENISNAGYDFYHNAYDEAKALNVVPAEIDYKPSYGVNMGVFCCTDIAYLPFLKKYYLMVKKYVDNIQNVWDKLQHKYWHCCVFEQLCIVNMLENANIEFAMLLNEDTSALPQCKSLYTHLWGADKRNVDNVLKINQQLKWRGY